MNTELLLLIVDRLNKLLIKKLNNIEFTNKELNEMKMLKQKVQDHSNTRTLSDIILTDIDKITKRENYE